MDKEKLYDIRIEYSTQSSDGFAYLKFRHIPAQVPHDALERALAIARNCDSVLVFAGNPLHFESEGADRPEMGLPGDQDELISAVARTNPNTVVVLNAGSPVLMPWINEVRSVVLAYYPGQEGGHAIADILFGNVNPSGKLTFTIPGKYEDNPSFLNYPGSRDVLYGEGIFVGYRYYDTKDVSPLFCFGHGLSYTNFEYSELVAPESIKQGEVLEISFKVKNTGDTPGKEVAQVYINDQRSRLQRPIKELKAFSKVYLEAGEEKIVTLKLNERAFSYFDPDRKSWVAEPGVFNILVGSSSRDIRVKRSFTLVD
jgi:beta-glucosidase